MNDQENIKKIQAREAEWSEIYSEMAEGSGEPLINPKKVEQPDPMAQVLHHLNVRVKEEQEVLERFEKCEFSDVDEFIVKGTIEGLEYAIKQIEDALYENVQVTKHMSIKQRRDDAKTAVNTLRDYLITGKRGTHGTEESN